MYIGTMELLCVNRESIVVERETIKKARKGSFLCQERRGERGGKASAAKVSSYIYKQVIRL